MEFQYEPQLKLLIFGKAKIGIILTILSLRFSKMHLKLLPSPLTCFLQIPLHD